MNVLLFTLALGLVIGALAWAASVLSWRGVQPEDDYLRLRCDKLLEEARDAYQAHIQHEQSHE